MRISEDDFRRLLRRYSAALDRLPQEARRVVAGVEIWTGPQQQESADYTPNA
jgi:hypothetical protein